MIDTDQAYQLFYITCSTFEEANTLGEKLVEKSLAACVNILPPSHSIYRWEGKIEKSQETIILAKSQKNRAETLKSFVKTHHSYDIPCIIALDIQKQASSTSFLRWIDQCLANNPS